jgi:hypothetical protein
MRKTLLILCALLALGLPVVATGSLRAADGTLSVEGGRGKVTVRARGGLIGRLERGTVTIFDLTPRDANVPVVSGVDRPVLSVGANGFRYRGAGIRFRVLGGNFRVVIEGRGIHLSVVGRGDGYLEGDALDPGLYSLEGDDCRKSPESCDTLPLPGIRFKLGGPDAGARGENTASARGEGGAPTRGQ